MNSLVKGPVIWLVLIVGSFGFGVLSASEQIDLLSSLLEGSGSTAYERALPEGVYESAREIYLVDLNGDNISEVMVGFAEESVNNCVEVYEYGGNPSCYKGWRFRVEVSVTMK